jgi:hypothetical protein
MVTLLSAYKCKSLSWADSAVPGFAYCCCRSPKDLRRILGLGALGKPGRLVEMPGIVQTYGEDRSRAQLIFVHVCVVSGGDGIFAADFWQPPQMMPRFQATSSTAPKQRRRNA